MKICKFIAVPSGFFLSFCRNHIIVGMFSVHCGSHSPGACPPTSMESDEQQGSAGIGHRAAVRGCPELDYPTVCLKGLAQCRCLKKVSLLCSNGVIMKCFFAVKICSMRWGTARGEEILSKGAMWGSADDSRIAMTCIALLFLILSLQSFQMEWMQGSRHCLPCHKDAPFFFLPLPLSHSPVQHFKNSSFSSSTWLYFYIYCCNNLEVLEDLQDHQHYIKVV